MFKKNLPLKNFLKEFPEYHETAVLDKLRKTDFKRLDNTKHVYLDYTGGNLYAESLVNVHHEALKKEVYGNPHSTNPSSQRSTKLVEDSRAYVLEYFNAGDDYFCIFTPNASGALKIVGECYPFDKDAFLLLSLDNHNSVNGIREFAKRKGAQFKYTPLEDNSLFLDGVELRKNLENNNSKKNKLFAYPAQSNVSGIKHPMEYVKFAKGMGWDVLLDTAAFVPSDRLNLKEVQPDFAVVSFYKIFGYPTGLGCLLMKKTAFNKMVKPWYAGGTISLSAVTFDAHYLMPNHERFEDGTVNYLDIPAIKNGLQYVEKIGIDVIKKRVKSISGWLLKSLNQLKHSSGQPLVKIFGAHNMENRGGTLVMNFYDKDGKLYPFSFIESEANKRNISIRTGCFCNPGLDETNNNISHKDLQSYFGAHEEGDFYHMIDFIGKLRGSVRISIGLATNFKDVHAFYNFAADFIDK